VKLKSIIVKHDILFFCKLNIKQQMYTLLTILLVVAGILLTSKAQNQRLTTLMVVLLMVLVVCYIRYMVNRRGEGFITSNYNFAPVSYTMSGGCSGMDAPSTDLVYPAMAPLAWDGLVLKSTPKPDVPLISDVTIFSPVGDGIRLTEAPDAKNFPTVDGKDGSPRHMFMLAHNQVRPECCPSTFSSDRGCICLTEAQKNLINKRWGNRSTDLYPNI
jgi:hypothetical protein